MLKGGRKFAAFVIITASLWMLVGVAFFGLKESPDDLATILLGVLAVFGGSYGALAAGNSLEHKYKGNDTQTQT